MFNNFMPTPLANSSQPMQMYARGGHAQQEQPYYHEAEMLRGMGTGRDQILAHINPAEAAYLSHNHGMTINPHTGLPQFGFFDAIRSGLGRAGSAISAAAPGLWEQYGRPIAQQALGGLDTGIQNALPGIGKSIGSAFGGERGGAIGESFGKNIGNQYGQLGGITGQVVPRVDQQAGLQTNGPNQLNPRSIAANTARGVWGDVGQNMAREGLINADMRLMNAIQPAASQLGGALGGRFGRREQGASLGSQFGGNVAEAFGNTPGMSGYVMNRANRAVQNLGIPTAPPPPPMPQRQQRMPEEQMYAEGGMVNQMPQMGMNQMPMQQMYGSYY